MKKIGILFGEENTFPQAFVDRVNEKKVSGIIAEPVSIDKVMQGEPTDYAVIIDRISQDVPFYRSYLKNAAIGGTAVINNPFWWSADEKFFNNALAMSVGVAVPKTVILPSHERPTDTSENSFRNLKFPIDWDGIFNYIGFPAYMKPHAGGGWKSVYRVENAEQLFRDHAETGQLVMMLQEEIQFTEYFRCYCLGTDNVHIMQYEPRNPHHLRYVRNAPPVAKSMLDKVREGVIKLNKGLGYDFNTVEFAIRDGIPYAIDFCNPAPDADVHSVGQENFDWIVENAADLAIKKAKAHKTGKLNLTWGTFVSQQFAKGAVTAAAKATVAKAKPGPKPAAKVGRPAKAKPGPKPKSQVKAKPTTAPKIEKAVVVRPAGPAKKTTAAKAPAVKKTVVAKTAAPKVTAAKPSTPKKATPPKAAAPKKSVAAKKVPAAKKPAAPKKASTAKIAPKATGSKAAEADKE